MTPRRAVANPYRRCGRSGIEPPEVSSGLWQNFGDDRPIDTCVTRAEPRSPHGEGPIPVPGYESAGLHQLLLCPLHGALTDFPTLGQDLQAGKPGARRQGIHKLSQESPRAFDGQLAWRMRHKISISRSLLTPHILTW